MKALALLAAGVGAGLLASSALGPQLIDRNASGVKIAVNGKDEALLTHTSGGKLKHMLAWGAMGGSLELGRRAVPRGPVSSGNARGAPTFGG